MIFKNEVFEISAESETITESVSAPVIIIKEGAVPVPPEGKALTLTSQGIEIPVAPGEYKDAVLKITDDFVTPVDGFNNRCYRTALYIDSGGINDDRSVPSAVTGDFTASEIKNAKIKSENDMFTGVIIDSAECTMNNVEITLRGHGGNDFSGIGTGIMAVGKGARLRAEGLHIKNNGVIRNAIIAADYADVEISHSDINVKGGDEEEQARVEKILSKKFGRTMTGVPWLLGLYGSNRATNVVGSGHVTYSDSVIRSDGWGVLSTDGVDNPVNFGDYQVELKAQRCLLEIAGRSGYGSYSIGACRNTFEDCIMNVPDYALIAANEYASGRFINTTVNSKRFGVMWHQNQGGKLSVKNSVFNTGMAPFLIKSCYPDIFVENSILSSKNGIILQLMDTDDPGMGSTEYISDTVIPEKDEGHDVSGLNYQSANIFGQKIENLCTDARAIFRNMVINGDFYNSTTNGIGCGMDMVPDRSHDSEPPTDGMGPEGPGEGAAPPPPAPSTCAPINLVLGFENVILEGIITSSEGKHAVKKITRENCIELGQITNKPAPAVNNGVIVSLDSRTIWNVTGDCWLTGLNIAYGAIIRGTEGRGVMMEVNGKAQALIPGEYKGEIKITVT